MEVLYVHVVLWSLSQRRPFFFASLRDHDGNIKRCHNKLKLNYRQKQLNSISIANLWSERQFTPLIPMIFPPCFRLHQDDSSACFINVLYRAYFDADLNGKYRNGDDRDIRTYIRSHDSPTSSKTNESHK